MKNTERYYAYLCSLVNEEGRNGSTASKSGGRPLFRSQGVKITLSRDWLDTAEEALPHLRRAISQNRQELRDETEEKRIELVKKTSPDSVRDLARHSERMTDSENGFIPRTLRVPENDSDYRTYENRFLWTALCTLRDFTDSVLRSAADASHTSHVLKMDMQSENDGTGFTLRTDFSAEAKGLGSCLTADDLSHSDSIQNEIQELTALPLFRDFTEKDLIDLPITPTNIILMNPDFAAVNELLDYLVAYRDAGFTAEEYELDSQAVSREGEDELAALLPLYCAVADAEAGLFDRKKVAAAAYSRKSAGIHASAKAADTEKLRAEYERLLEKAGEEAEKRLETELAQREAEWKEKLETAGAELTALRISCGLTSDPEYMTEDGFIELERQKECFDRFYKERLVLMKKAARKKYLWVQLKHSGRGGKK